MSEFCLDCWKRLNDDAEETEEAKKEKDYKLSRHETLCEGCGEWKRVVTAIR